MKTSKNLILTIFLLVLFHNVNGQDENDSKFSAPITTPAETNYITIWYRLDGNKSIYIYFGDNKADLVIVPSTNLDKLNNKKLGLGQSGNVASYIVDLLNRYDKEGFDLVSTETYVPINTSISANTANLATPSWTQCFLKKRK